MAKVIVRKELKVDQMEYYNLIDPILEKSKGEENIVIKCNSIHIEAIRDKVEVIGKKLMQ